MTTSVKHIVLEEKEDGSAGGGVRSSVGSARSPPKAIVGATEEGRGGHATSDGFDARTISTSLYLAIMDSHSEFHLQQIRYFKYLLTVYHNTPGTFE